VEARRPGKAAEDNADALLLGHSHNVCAIDVNTEAGYVVTGSWDQSARIWKVGKWQADIVLGGHKGSVWAVLAFDRDTIITGLELIG
jgi:phospholipase A-2-activating protein